MANVIYRSYQNERQNESIYAAPTYSKTYPQFQEEIDKKTGKVRIVMCGEIDRYSITQDCKHDACLYTYVDAFLKGEDVSQFIGAVEPKFMDLVNSPMDYMTAQNAIAQAKQTFDTLSIADRNKFGNSWQSWLKDLQSRAKRSQAIGKSPAPAPASAPAPVSEGGE